MASGPGGSHHEAKVAGPGVVTGRSGKLGDVFLMLEDFWPLNTTLWVKEFRGASPYYAFHLLGTLALENFNAGSAVPTLNRNHVHSLPVLLPPKAFVDIFDRQAESVYIKTKQNKEQSETLAALRDTLLPKLLSGEVRVPKAMLAQSEGANL
jgi:type I restriction enzyme, S subunit